jgi:hypothetical protein
MRFFMRHVMEEHVHELQLAMKSTCVAMAE